MNSHQKNRDSTGNYDLAAVIHDLAVRIPELVEKDNFTVNASVASDILLLSGHLVYALIPSQSRKEYAVRRDNDQPWGGSLHFFLPGLDLETMVVFAKNETQQAVMLQDYLNEIQRAAKEKSSVKRLEGDRT